MKKIIRTCVWAVMWDKTVVATAQAEFQAERFAEMMNQSAKWAVENDCCNTVQIGASKFTVSPLYEDSPEYVLNDAELYSELRRGFDREEDLDKAIQEAGKKALEVDGVDLVDITLPNGRVKTVHWSKFTVNHW